MEISSNPFFSHVLSPLLREAQQHPVVISDGNESLGAIVSMEDYGLVQQAKAEEFLRVSARFGEEVRARAGEDGLTPEDLGRMLDRKAG